MRHGAFFFAVAFALAIVSDPVWADDRQVAEQIAHRLQSSGQLRGYDVRVKFEKRTASLRGRVATKQQMAAALALAAQTKGVEKVVNGLTVRTEPLRTTVAPIAPRRPVDYAVDQARLVPNIVSRVPVAPSQTPAARPLAQVPASPAAPIETSPTPLVQLPTTTEMAFSAPLTDSLKERPDAVGSLRRPESSAISEVVPATAQRAGFWTSTGQAHATDLHLATSLAGYAEPMLLPDETGTAEEVFVCDEPRQPTTQSAEEKLGQGTSPTTLAASGGLIQPVPQPSRRTWAGGFGQHSPASLRATVRLPQ